MKWMYGERSAFKMGDLGGSEDFEEERLRQEELLEGASISS